MPILQWLDREKHVKAADAAPYRLLEADDVHSAGDSNTPNMLIQGDNLDALKALLPYYAGRVKCVYIDPPFNTGSDFPNYDDNIEHSLWLGMFRPRAQFLHSLLSDDGTLVLHLDDNEIAYATVLLDEIFGRKNRVYMVTFKQSPPKGHKTINPGLVTIANYIIIYSKNKEKWSPNRAFAARPRDKRYNSYIENFCEDMQKWRLIPVSAAFFASLGVKKISDAKKQLGAAYETKLDAFVLENADRVVQPVRPDYDAVGRETQELIDISSANPDKMYRQERGELLPIYLKDGMRWLFYSSKLRMIDGKYTTGEALSNVWDDLLSNNIHNEGGVKFPKGKKPEALIKRIFDLFTSTGDLILDSFLGSGTTIAVAHKMGLKYVGIEMGEHAVSLCVPRLQRVISGDQGGVSSSTGWKGGGGFRFYRLGAPIFDTEGRINPQIRFAHLAAHVWFSETHTALHRRAKTPFLGAHEGVGYYLLYNGVLGDKRPDGGNVLTARVLAELPPFDGPKVIYGEASRIGPARLKALDIVFKQTPYDVKAR